MRRRPPFPAVLLAVLLFTVILSTGCGGSSQGNGIAAQTPTEIVNGAKILADAATSVHIYGSVQSGGTPTAVNLYLLASKGGRGQVSANGLSFELIQIHGNAFIKGSEAFYRHIAGPAAGQLPQLLEGKWLKAPASGGDFASLASLTDLRQLMDATLPAHGPLAKGATTKVNGQKVLGVTDTSTGGTLYVATTGPPYPIEITMGKAGAGAIVFDQWNQPVSITAPANPIDIAQLQSGH
jgi:hypothetical protein